MAKNKHTPEQELLICNLVSQGKSLADAKKQVESQAKKEAPKKAEDAPKKLSAAEKKEAIRIELDALEAEIPPEGASAAIWQQALDTAKEAAANEIAPSDLM